MGIEINELTSLVEAVQNGEDGAFEKLYHKSFRHAYSTASLLLKNKEDIEDVLQNSYMYVSLYIKDLKKPESFNNWLGVIVKHECQKHIAKQKRISDIFFTVKKNKEFYMEEENLLPSDYFEKEERIDAVQRIIDDLPEDKRACIVMFYYEQNSLAEIAEILGVPEGTVMSRLYYARKKLEKEFKKLQKKDEALYGISVIPFIVSFIDFKAKTLTVPASAEIAVITAVTSSGGAMASAAATGTSAAGAGTAATGTATAAGTSAVSSVAGTAGTAVATKVAAVAVAAAVATGGGAAMAKHIKSDTQEVTTQISSVATTEDHATVADVFYAAVTFEETTLPETRTSESAYSSKPSTEKVISSNPAVSASSTSKPAATKKTTSARTTVIITTSKPSTTSALTTAKPTTTAKPSTTVNRTTEKSTEAKTEPTEQTSPATNNFKISNGVLNEYTGNESNVQIPSTVTAIGTGAFSGNTSITSVTIPSGVTRIGLEAFSDCTNLRSVSLPSSLQSIGVAAFYGCSSLTSVTIPEGTQTISDEAFSNCSSLSSVTIPDSVTSISEDAFYGSDNVTIKCSEGSAAHDYAVANSIKYELI